MRDVNYTRDVHLHVGWWACVTCEQNLFNPWRWTTDVVVGGEPFTRPFSSLSLSKGYRNTLFLCTLSNWNSRLIPPAEMFRLAMVTFGDYTLFIYRLFLIDPTAVLAKLILTRWRNWPRNSNSTYKLQSTLELGFAIKCHFIYWNCPTIRTIWVCMIEYKFLLVNFDDEALP